MVRVLHHSIVFALLTLLTQIGGVAWLFSLWFRNRLFVFLFVYAAMTTAAVWVAPLSGRTALNCWDEGPLQVQSWFFCVSNRNYVTSELAEVLKDAAVAVDRAYPGTETQVLDTSFPFFTGFPLLPHLSHDDGEKADLALYYRDGTGYLSGRTRSPIGYFAFEEGHTDCPNAWPTLRWNLRLIQWMWADYTVEPDRTRFLLSTLVTDPRVGKILVEPHLKSALRLNDPKVRFQGCRAARHDDHIHLQLQ